MKCLILAAGYATRLSPLTENYPKPLLKVGDKAILDWLIDDLKVAGGVDEFVVVTNHKFAGIFDSWAASRPESIRVVDDGTSTNETRLGAVIDMKFAIDKCGIDDDLIVMAGDNLLSFSLGSFVDYFRQKGASCVMRYYEPDASRLHKRGVLDVDASGRILSMEEKPAVPRSHWCCPPFYIYSRQDLRLLDDAIASGCGVDAPGSLVSWLCSRVPMYAMQMPGERYDIGDLKSYEEVRGRFEGR